MKWRHALFLVAILVCTSMLAFLFFSPRPYIARRVLSDGTILTLVAMKTGRKHESPLATFPEKLAARLPAGWRAPLKLTKTPDATYSSISSNYLSVWFTVEGKSSPPLRLPLHVWVGDDRDNFGVSEEFTYATRVGTQLNSSVWLEGLPVLSWPRRAKTLRIQVFQNDGTMVTEFRMKNPQPDAKSSPWVASPLPVTLRKGDLDFTLTSLWVGLGPDWMDWKLSPEPNHRHRSTRATFRVTRQGEPQTNWNAHFIPEIRDATGNWSCSRYYSRCEAGETMNHFNRPPPPMDEAWRMTVEFSRVSDFTTGELHAVKGFALPPAGLPLVISNAFGAHRLAVQWERAPPLTADSYYALTATAEPRYSDHRLTLVRATDDHGRNVRIGNHGSQPSTAFCTLGLSADATSVDLVFAFHASRFVTFQAKPQFYRPQPVDPAQLVPPFR